VTNIPQPALSQPQPQPGQIVSVRRFPTRSLAIVGLTTMILGQLRYVWETSVLLLLWPEAALVPLALGACVLAARRRGGLAVVAGCIGLASHGELFLTSLQGTIESSGVAELGSWLARGQNLSELSIVVGGCLSVGAGLQLHGAEPRR
jgi:hypothetical protein